MVAQLGGGTMPSKAKGQRPNRKLLGTYSAPVLAVRHWGQPWNGGQ